MPPRHSPLVAFALALALAFPAAAQETEGAAGAYLAAQVAASENDFREAARWYDRLIQIGVNDAATLEGAVIAHLSLGDFERAADLSRQLLQQGGRSQTAYIALLTDQATEWAAQPAPGASTQAPLGVKAVKTSPIGDSNPMSCGERLFRLIR